MEREKNIIKELKNLNSYYQNFPSIQTGMSSIMIKFPHKNPQLLQAIKIEAQTIIVHVEFHFNFNFLLNNHEKYFTGFSLIACDTSSLRSCRADSAISE